MNTHPSSLIPQAYPALARSLQSQADHGTVHHSTIFCTARPEDGLYIIYYALRLLYCEQRPDQLCAADSACRQCSALLAGQHPDCLVIESPVETTGLSVDQVRQMKQHLSAKPQVGCLRSVALPGLNAATPAALNALLKVMEEPPPASLLLAGATDPTALPDTIRSRAHCLQISGLTQAEAEAVLAALQLPLTDQAQQQIAAASGSLHRLYSFVTASGPAWEDWSAASQWWGQFAAAGSGLADRQQLLDERLGKRSIDRQQLMALLEHGLEYLHSQLPLSDQAALITPRLELLYDLLTALKQRAAPSFIIDRLILSF